MISRVVRFYALGFRATMEMPIKVFWSLVGNIHKIEADEDRRALRVALCSQSSEGAKALFDEYDERLKGVVVIAADNPMNAKPDRDAINELKGMLRQMQ